MIAQSLSPTSPLSKIPPTSPSATTSGTSLGPFSSPSKGTKNIHKVSFKDRIKALQNASDTSKIQEKSISNENSDMKQQLIPPSSPGGPLSNSGSTSSSSNKFNNSKPSTAQTIKEKLRSFGNFEKTKDDHSVIIKPWSKLKLATVIGGSYTSLSNTLTEDSPTIRKGKVAKNKPTTSSVQNLVSRHADSISISIQNEQASVSDSEIKNLPRVVPKLKQKPKPIKIAPIPKSYQSVDDLSPEYGGLPFVKKLKILNERQKLAELESVIQTRSFSLDCTDSNNTAQGAMEALYRSHSEASCMARSKTTVTTIHGTPIVTGGIGQQSLKSPLSPESNETLERRHLKSILKKLSEDKLTESQEDQQDLCRLLRSQTLEGYVARHSKFTKSVTFNRNTLSSPPGSAGLPHGTESVGLPERTFFPISDAKQPRDGDHLIQTSTAEEIKISSRQTVTETEFHHVQSKIKEDSPSKLPFFTAIPSNQRKIIKGKLLIEQRYQYVLSCCTVHCIKCFTISVGINLPIPI